MHMDVMMNGCDSGAGFAVIRSFAPARIERELLAQIFEVLQHCAAIADADTSRSNSLVDRPPESAIRPGGGEALSDDTTSYRLVAREAAA
jgi:hypothetical protein